ncbi:hypothetical protein L3N51_01592 [Metallosphaera sp. J1]|uniref:AbrB/MazE/SpoVT family DNA-binding domain-containing protein n=1 Tax=Metallosphaera javensis (ex Hofmann et al. 2022) TaxID=99938 RepID=UPI001EDED62F|nr:AbrB/MazE/SpoVT family DNA-binding domain-containing protein [Metallosphaera javensis (ex Hofmann et al. 2022)]MCG3109302.1 hypothetical protein [Metallosphaera javensis (ex Hofmann et al. 2022)]
MVKVTDKFQVTIPREVRERIGIKPGEEVEVQVLNDNEILIKRKVKRVKDPLPLLIGEDSGVEIPPEKVDELAEG